MQETFHLLKSPNNAARLLKGIAEYEKGLGQERTKVYAIERQDKTIYGWNSERAFVIIMHKQLGNVV